MHPENCLNRAPSWLPRALLASLLLLGACAEAPVTAPEMDAVFLPEVARSETPSQIVLDALVRDFSSSHPDFEQGFGRIDLGIVTATLGVDGKPVYAGGTTGTTNGQANFDQWYRAVDGVNQSTSVQLVLQRQPNGVYRYSSSEYFPIDGQLLGNEGRAHNFHFTTEIHTTFTYSGGEVFTFTGDDDVWVYIDGTLVIDLGGVYPPRTSSVALDNLGLTVGETYTLAIFQAERQTFGSSFTIETTLQLISEPPPVLDTDGDGVPDDEDAFPNDPDRWLPEVVFTSGVTVRTWDPIIPATQPADWGTSICTSTPLFPPTDPAWTGEHNSFVLGGHPWAGSYFTAPWINSWNNLGSNGAGGPAPYHNWTKYETPVFGTGDYVVRLLADNCSWVYLDGTLIGVQGNDLSKNTYPVDLTGTHTLTFVIFDGGGAAGGKFRLESLGSFVSNGGNPGNIQPPLIDTDGDGAPDILDAFPTDPTEIRDTDNDGRGDNSDAFPNDPNEQDDSDGDGVGDNADAFPNDPNETVDSDGDGVGDNSDAFPNDPNESADSDGDGVGDNADAFPNDPSETVDTDLDGIGNNTDNCSLIANADQTDQDGDGLGDACDPDRDGDGVDNDDDAFPDDGSETADSDGDGVGDNADAFLNDPNEWADSDGDERGDNSDAFPNDPSEQDDSDGDGVGDNADAFPNDPTETTDSDGDGFGDNGDPFPNSVIGGSLMVGTCDSGVANQSLGDGSTFADRFGAAQAAARNHGQFVTAVSSISNGWKKDGLITGRDHGKITSCAARSR